MFILHLTMVVMVVSLLALWDLIHIYLWLLDHLLGILLLTGWGLLVIGHRMDVFVMIRGWLVSWLLFPHFGDID